MFKKEEKLPVEISSNKVQEIIENIAIPKKEVQYQTKINALSLKSLNEIRNFNQNKPKEEVQTVHLSEDFSQDALETVWKEYTNELEVKGKHILLSYMTMSKPVKMANHVHLEFPNEGPKNDFESQYNELLGVLKTKLKNHDIKIVIHVNQAIQAKKIYSKEDKYKYFVEKNPLLEKMRNLFELDF